MFVYRMHRPSSHAFDTTGAYLHEGRWHSAGTRLIYAAQHASLAVLESLVNAAGRKLSPRLITRIFFPDGCAVEQAAWLDKPDSRRFGDAWVVERRTAILAVPSVVVNKMELNFLLNPAHPEFARFTCDPPEEFVFDPRFSVGSE
jgi:RES domain-containing protein